MKSILQNVVSTGTSRGIHHWLTYLSCPNRAHLSGTLGQRSSEGSDLTDIGSIYHAYMEAYHKMKGGRYMSTEAIRLDVRGDEQVRKKAETLFRGYRARFKPNHYGKVLSVEEHMELKEGLPVPYTFRPDLVVHTAPITAKRLGIRAGYYVVDHKTRGGSYPLEDMQDTHSLQFAAYMYAWNRIKQNQQVIGTIVNIVYRSTNPVYRWTIVPYQYSMEKILLKTLEQIAEIKRTRPTQCNPTACYSWTRLCPFYARCRRY